MVSGEAHHVVMHRWPCHRVHAATFRPGREPSRCWSDCKVWCCSPRWCASDVQVVTGQGMVVWMAFESYVSWNQCL